ncbi:trypsin-like peptidase domain-containing protein [Paracandidimonas soli]|uniref:Serine protease DegQ n=1 Tax=Paracandidimonas soli TaxID=1917182 RepID=A0A4R3UYT7_9BURK|nr:trypsin-like peptidase domain-containing protein [Paracandidimonas soli]TCU96033.1 serine protease DegQ [Paracandidimonas soli]
MRRLWLLFAQTVTVCLGILFIVATLRPEWVGMASRPVVAPPPSAANGNGNGAAAPLLSFASAVASATPSVVNIYTSKQVDVPLLQFPNDPELNRLFGELPGFSRRKQSTSLGSGVIARADGHILTNYHVIEAADAIEVALSDGRQARAKLVGGDPESDLAVLKIDLPDLQAITYAKNEALRVGDVVLAIGNPFGVGQTTTMGIVSALGRNRLGINIYENFIQTDAAINPGNSGGALIDGRGRMVGINTAIYSETGGSLGIGFAIPAPVALMIMEQIIEHGEVTRGWLGLEPQDITPDLARAFRMERRDGVIVASVLRNGPAWTGGIRVGDIILSLDEEPVRDSIGFLNQIAPLQPGSKATLGVLRDGKARELSVKVGKRPAQMPN